MDATDFLSKILWDLSNLDESAMSNELNMQLIGIRGEIGSYLGLDEIHLHEQDDDRDSCSHCGEYHSMGDGCPNDPDDDLSPEHDSDYDRGQCGCDLGMDPNTECPTCS
jgi:hypothetical protein